VRGFSLLELMVVLAIMALLLIVSVHGYQSYFSKINSQHAKLALYSIATKMEDYHQEHATYEGVSLANLGFVNTINTIKNYNFVIADVSQQHFTIIAYAQGTQVNFDKNCKTMSLKDTGEFSCAL
jgi:prepilin-type N-terminal cleavage/methylation domain-containing protein